MHAFISTAIIQKTTCKWHGFADKDMGLYMALHKGGSSYTHAHFLSSVR